MMSVYPAEWSVIHTVAIGNAHQNGAMSLTTSTIAKIMLMTT